MDCNGFRLLIADSDTDAREFLAAQLTADGYEVLAAGSRAAALRLLRTGTFDAAVLALAFDDGDGLELARLIRGSGGEATPLDPEMPLLALSPGGSEIERLRAFEHGCDDLLVLPYWYPELRLRIAALLRRCGPRQFQLAARVRVGRLELDVPARQAWIDGKRIRLASREFALLRMLASDPQRVFSREELLSSVWGWDGASNTRTVDTHACRLRRKLAVAGDHYVINVWGVGYRLIDARAPVLELRPSVRLARAA
jgi:DNA-binding response OmpR family regulator